jgi:hypothetical protein
MKYLVILNEAPDPGERTYDLVEIGSGVEANAILVGPARIVVLDAVADEMSDTSVVLQQRELHTKLAVRSEEHGLVGAIELEERQRLLEELIRRRERVLRHGRRLTAQRPVTSARAACSSRLHLVIAMSAAVVPANVSAPCLMLPLLALHHSPCSASARSASCSATSGRVRSIR